MLVLYKNYLLRDASKKHLFQTIWQFIILELLFSAMTDLKII
jgi:hypothetical protein